MARINLYNRDSQRLSSSDYYGLGLRVYMFFNQKDSVITHF